MKNRKFAAGLAMAMLTAAMVTGCGNAKTEEPADGTAVETGAAETEVQSEEVKTEEGNAEEMETELYNAYIDANNVFVGRYYDVLDSYFRFVPFQEEFAPENPDYQCLSLGEYDMKKLDDANEMISAKKEKQAVDDAYLELYPVAKELITALNEVSEYTDLKSYVDDDYARGKELHATIMKNYELYSTLSDKFMEEVSTMADAQQEKDLASLKAEGYELTYSMNVALNTAQDIQDAIYQQEITDEEVIELDTAALKPLYDQFAEEVTQCLDNLKNEEMLKKEGLMSAQVMLFERALTEAKVALSELFQRVEEQKALESYEMGIAIPAKGSISKFDDCLSKLIDEYNRIG